MALVLTLEGFDDLALGEEQDAGEWWQDKMDDFYPPKKPSAKKTCPANYTLRTDGVCHIKVNKQTEKNVNAVIEDKKKTGTHDVGDGLQMTWHPDKGMWGIDKIPPAVVGGVGMFLGFSLLGLGIWKWTSRSKAGGKGN